MADEYVTDKQLAAMLEARAKELPQGCGIEKAALRLAAMVLKDVARNVYYGKN